MHPRLRQQRREDGVGGDRRIRLHRRLGVILGRQLGGRDAGLLEQPVIAAIGRQVGQEIVGEPATLTHPQRRVFDGGAELR